MDGLLNSVQSADVALLAEGVDRNPEEEEQEETEVVALLAEGVDRNYMHRAYRDDRYVALLAEGVDRNIQQTFEATPLSGSPSSRRAWIEMSMSWAQSGSTQSRPPRGGRG